MDLRKVAVKELVVIGKLLFMENELSMINGFRGVCHIHLDTFFPRLKGGCLREREHFLAQEPYQNAYHCSIRGCQ